MTPAGTRIAYQASGHPLEGSTTMFGLGIVGTILLIIIILWLLGVIG